MTKSLKEQRDAIVKDMMYEGSPRYLRDQNAKFTFEQNYYMIIDARKDAFEQCHALMLKEREGLVQALEYYSEVSTWELTEAKALRTIGDEDLEMADEGGPFAPGSATWVAGKAAREALKSLEEGG